MCGFDLQWFELSSHRRGPCLLDGRINHLIIITGRVEGRGPRVYREERGVRMGEGQGRTSWRELEK